MGELAAASTRVKVWFVVSLVLAVGLSLAVTRWSAPLVSPVTLATAAALVAGSVLNIEIGRLFEGGTVAQQRPHKALSAWPMAATILLPAVYLLPIVTLIYAHARWRGVRVTMWKWVLSAGFLVSAGSISGLLVLNDASGEPPELDTGSAGLLLVLGAVLVFLTVEVGMLAISSRVNTAADEVWLRKTLTDPAFYLTEAGVLCVGALTAVIAATEPWFVLLLIPVYGFLQMSVLHRPLQELATRDGKTGLLHFNEWQRLAAEEIRRLSAAGRPWAVMFADIDNFRFYNERHGHLGGDEAINLVAQIITARVRPKDVTARFGGEEFCVLLPDTTAETAGQVAERIRLAIWKETSALPEIVTVSVGIAAVEGGRTPMELAVVLALADQALYQAKMDGRNTVRLRSSAAIGRQAVSPPSNAPLGDERSDSHQINAEPLEGDHPRTGPAQAGESAELRQESG